MKNYIYKVIDGDNLLLLATFENEDREEVFKRYQNDPRWSDVDFDIDGDIICFRES